MCIYPNTLTVQYTYNTHASFIRIFNTTDALLKTRVLIIPLNAYTKYRFSMNANLHNIWDVTLNILYAHNNAFAHINKDNFDYYSKNVLKGGDMWPRCILYIEGFKFYNTLLAENNTELYIRITRFSQQNTITDSFVAWHGGHRSHGHGQPLHANIFMNTNCIIRRAYSRIESSEPFQVLNWRAKEFGCNAVVCCVKHIVRYLRSLHIPHNTSK